MVFLLDTNVVSELRRAKPHGAVLAWIRNVDDADLCISAVTLGELQAGVEVTREQDESKAQELQEWVDLIAASYNILPMDGAAFRTWATLIHRKSDTLNEDAMIAAVARVHKLTVVTGNTGDFRSFGVPLLNPFKAT
jgi:predicted nucleic acid-binding protein